MPRANRYTCKPLFERLASHAYSPDQNTGFNLKSAVLPVNSLEFSLTNATNPSRINE
jgi:hypothetical protein